MAAALAAISVQAQAKTFHTDTVFAPPSAGGSGPFNPNGALAADAQGRLYGVTLSGGTHHAGTVYRLTPGPLKSDPWTTETLHNFTGSDGSGPWGAVYIDAAGAVYGTADGGGSFGLGNVYRLDNAPGWPITILHNFGGSPDGDSPLAGVAPSKDGLLYGTTRNGGRGGWGTAFAVSPLGDSVSYQLIHSFENGMDGQFPTTFTIKGDGEIYGILSYDIRTAVFRLAEKDGIWRNNLIYKQQAPFSNLYLSSILNGPNGVLFLCDNRGSYGYAIQLSPPPFPGPWTETDLYRFKQYSGGCSSLTINPSGGFVGTTTPPGGKVLNGTLFSLTPALPGTNAYTFRTLHRFPGTAEYAAGALLRLGGLYYGATVYSQYLPDSGGEVFDVRP